MRGGRWFVSAGALLAAGCGDDGTLPPSACEEGAFVGDWREVRITEDGPSEVTPTDLSNASISATTAEGRTVEGRGFLGGFRIDGLPAGPITVRIDREGSTVAYVTSGCRWRSMGYRLGIDAPYPGPETSLAAEVTGLAPWSDGDLIETFAPRSWSRHEFWIPGQPKDGATSLFSGETYGATMAMVDGGEPVRVFQSSLSAASTPETSVRTLVASRDLTRFTMREGEENLLQATLLPLEDTEEISFAIDADAFHALATDAPVNGFTRSVSVGAQYYATLPGVAFAQGGGAVESLIVQTAGTGVVALERVAFSDPFPAAWPRVSAVYATETLRRELYEISREIYTVFGPGADLDGAMLTPLISPPRNVTIGGQPLEAVTEPVGEAPVVAWDPPLVGEATLSSVGINTVDENGFWDGTVARLFVEGANEITIPAGILQPGRRYELSVQARSGDAIARAYGQEPFTP